MSPEDTARVDAIRATVARETSAVNEMLASVSDPAIKARITLLRRDFQEVETVLLKDVASSATPHVLISLTERWVAGLVRIREEWQQLLAKYGKDAKLVG